MGEYADMAMDQAFDAWCEGEDGEYDQDGTEHDDSFWIPKSRTKTCRNCGEVNLRWGKHQGGWRLFSKGHKLHQCNLKPMKYESCIEEAKHRKFDGKSVFEMIDMLMKTEDDGSPWRKEGMELISLIKRLCEEAMRHDPKRMCDPPAGWRPRQ